MAKEMAQMDLPEKTVIIETAWGAATPAAQATTLKLGQGHYCNQSLKQKIYKPFSAACPSCGGTMQPDKPHVYGKRIFSGAFAGYRHP